MSGEGEENREFEEGEEGREEGEEKIVEEEDENSVRLREQEAKFRSDIKENLSNLSKTACGGSYAYVKLNLAEKEVERLFPVIASYSELRYLDLSSNALTDISAITSLKMLVSLNCSKNQITRLDDLNPAADEKVLPFLQFINLSGNKLTRLVDLRLPSLRRLDLSENEIVTAEEFVGHSKLEFLNLNINKLKSLVGISDMPALKELTIEENEITDFRDLKNLPSLRHLSLRKNNLKRLRTPWPCLTELVSLNLSENVVEDFKEVLKVSLLPNILNFSFQANPCCDTVPNPKLELLITLDYFEKINDEEITPEDQTERLNLINEREDARKVAEEEARLAAEEVRKQEEEARKLAEEEEAIRKAAEDEARKQAEEEEALRKVAEEEIRLADLAAAELIQQQTESPEQELALAQEEQQKDPVE